MSDINISKTNNQSINRNPISEQKKLENSNTTGVSQPNGVGLPSDTNNLTITDAPSLSSVGGAQKTPAPVDLTALSAQIDTLDSSVSTTKTQNQDPTELNALSQDEKNNLSTFLKTATSCVDATAADPFAAKFSTDMSAILQLVQKLRRTMGEAYHNDMQGMRTDMSKQYDAKVDEMYKAAKSDFNASLAKGIGDITAGVVGVLPVVGSLGSIASGAGEIASGSYKYSADKSRARQTEMEGAIATTQSLMEEFGKFYDSLKQYCADARENVSKIKSESDATTQTITRNI